MSITTGIDIVNIKRISRIIEEQKERFLERVFSIDEITYCETKVNKYQHYAARFAAKEAFLKACPNSGSILALKEIEVKKDKDIPRICLNESKQYLSQKMSSISVSLSHEREFAVAVVVIEWQSNSD